MLVAIDNESRTEQVADNLNIRSKIAIVTYLLGAPIFANISEIQCYTHPTVTEQRHRERAYHSL